MSLNVIIFCQPGIQFPSLQNPSHTKKAWLFFVFADLFFFVILEAYWILFRKT